MTYSKTSNIRPRGMTLIELLVVVMLVTIFASILYPNYQSQILKAHRAAAISDLAKIQLELERQYRGSYALAAENVLPDGDCAWCKTNARQFSFSISATENRYIIKAHPTHSQTSDECGGERYQLLSLNQAGEYNPIKCWQ